MVRRCLRCGESWTVPGALASSRRASRWQRGVSAPDHLGLQGMTTNAAAAMRIEMAKAKGSRLDAELATTSLLAECPGCGAVGTYAERRLPRRRRRGGPAEWS